ncbi:MAG: hypothetical protein AAF688_07745 [Bacteroidota bacterium]
MNERTRQILSEISTVTRDIEQNYPELQKYLDESRSTLPKTYDENESMDKELQDYLDELKELIANYKK